MNNRHIPCPFPFTSVDSFSKALGTAFLHDSSQHWHICPQMRKEWPGRPLHTSLRPMHLRCASAAISCTEKRSPRLWRRSPQMQREKSKVCGSYSYSVRPNLFTELPTIFILCRLEALTSAIKLHPLKVEPWSKVMSEPEDIKHKEDEKGEDDKMPRKRPKMTHMNCRSSGLFIVSDEMKQMIQGIC